MDNEKVKEIKSVLNTWKIVFHGVTNDDILTLINELESENERLVKELEDMPIPFMGCMLENQLLSDISKEKNGEIKALKDRIAELENQMCRNEDLHTATEKLNDMIILKHFAERLKERLYDFQTWEMPYDEWCKGNVICGEIDETLKEFINGKV